MDRERRQRGKDGTSPMGLSDQGHTAGIVIFKQKAIRRRQHRLRGAPIALGAAAAQKGVCGWDVDGMVGHVAAPRMGVEGKSITPGCSPQGWTSSSDHVPPALGISPSHPTAAGWEKAEEHHWVPHCFLTQHQRLAPTLPALGVRLQQQVLHPWLLSVTSRGA